MRQKNSDDQGTIRSRVAPQPTEPKRMVQQQDNTTGQYNPYAQWTFEQLYSECKRRGLL